MTCDYLPNIGHSFLFTEYDVRGDELSVTHADSSEVFREHETCSSKI